MKALPEAAFIPFSIVLRVDMTDRLALTHEQDVTKLKSVLRNVVVMDNFPHTKSCT